MGYHRDEVLTAEVGSAVPNTMDPDATIVVDRDSLPYPSIPGYTITGRLGEGGMAQVYLAEDNSLKRDVAIKLMSHELSVDAGFRERFAREGQIVANFHHPHVVQVYSSGVVEDRHYLVMEYVPGDSLGSRLAEGPMDPARAAEVAAQLASALAYAHERDVVHRDFKPGNILFTEDDHAILCDFGIAKADSFADQGEMTATGIVIGSPRYMAPEQLRGERLTDKVDVYALGLVLYEMLVGDVPPAERRITQGPGDTKWLNSALPRTAQKLGGFIAACLAQDPTQRPSATDCVTTLTAFGGAHPLRRWAIYAAIATTAAVIASTSSVQMMRGEDGSQTHSVSLAEFRAFHSALEASPGSTVPAEVIHPIYAGLLELRDKKGTDREAFNTEIAELVSRAERGNAEAALSLYLADDSELTSMDATQLNLWLSRAAGSGLGLASYYQALRYRQENEADGGLDRAELLTLRDLLKQAESQSVDLGESMLKQIDVALGFAED